MFLNKFFKNHLTIPQATDLFEEVKSQTHPDIANLKRLVNFHKAPVGTTTEMQALDLKYRAMTHVPTTIEKTMTPAQLYASGSPLWANGYKGVTIERILEKLDGKPQTEESFNRTLASVLGSKNKGQMMFDEYGNIGGVHGNRLQVGRSQKHKYQKIKQKRTKE